MIQTAEPKQQSQIRQRTLDMLLTKIENRQPGQPDPILDACYDKLYCEKLGVKYNDRYNYSIIEQAVMQYKLERGRTE